MLNVYPPRVKTVSHGQWWTPFSVRFTVRNKLLAATLYVLAYQIAVSVVALVLLVSLVLEHLWLTLAVLFGLPLVMGNVVFVAVVIIIIIQNNAEVLLRKTECADPPPAHDPISMSKIHTGDWALHGGPVFNVLVLLVAGGAYFSQHILVRSLRSFPPWAQWLYFVYWMNATLLFMLTPYQIAFDVDKKYPTSFSVAERTLIELAVIWVWMASTWFIFTADHTIDRREILSSSRVEYLPSVPELRAGRWTGEAAPSTAHREMVISGEAVARAVEL